MGLLDTLTPLQGVYILLSSLLVYVVFNAIYQLYFDPLSTHPGPKLCAISLLPFTFHKIRGNETRWYDALHKTYGPVVRVAPRMVSYIAPEAWKDIYGHKHGDRGGVGKDPTEALDTLGGIHSLLWQPDQEHSRARRAVSHAFSEKAIREQEPLIRGYVDLLTQRLTGLIVDSSSSSDNKKKGETTVDMVNWYSFTTFDVMADLTFGASLGMLRAGKWDEWMESTFESVKQGVQVLAARKQLPALLQPVFDLFTPRSLVKAAALHIRESESRVDARLAQDTDRTDIWAFIMKKKQQGDKKGREEEEEEEEDGKPSNSLLRPEMHAMGKTLMLAGTETTATLLSGMTHILCLHRDKLDKLTKEIRDGFASPTDFHMTDIAALPYLHACMEEALRTYSPIPAGLTRLVPPGGKMICDRFVPEGTQVYVSPLAAFRSETNFAAPLEFIPERWLPDMPDARFANDKREVLQPFSYGPRNCLGKNLAYHEARLIITSMLWHFDMELADVPDNVNWLDQDTYALREKKPMMVKLTLAPHLLEKKP